MQSPTSKTKPKPNIVAAKQSDAPADSLPQPLHEWQFAAIGTSWWIGLYEPVGGALLTKIQAQITDLVDVFDARYSRFRPDSLVSKWARQAGTYALPPDAAPLLDLYRKLYDITEGAVTPLVGQLLSDAGYDATYSLIPKQTRRPPSWDEVLRVSDSEITLLKPALLDFGAAGKGYLVDRVCELLEGQGITAFCVDGSGDMRASGVTSALAIGLENPSNPQQVIGVAQLAGGALCGSAGNRRAWGDTAHGKPMYTHIMNPFTRQSQNNYQGVWVTAKTALVADGLTTALYFAEPAKLQKHFEFEYAVIKADDTLETSKHFPAEFFTKQAPAGARS